MCEISEIVKSRDLYPWMLKLDGIFKNYNNYSTEVIPLNLLTNQRQNLPPRAINYHSNN